VCVCVCVCVCNNHNTRQVALVLADMCLMQEARRNTVMQLPQEISPYFCDPTMNGDISYNGVLKVRTISVSIYLYVCKIYVCM
jgi:hypothetical protein